MQTFTEFFNTKYPIACMAMNKVSDVKLAIAVRNAGCLPSLSIFNYYVGVNEISVVPFERDLDAYYNEFRDASILISVDVGNLLELPGLLDALLKRKVKAVEIIIEDRKSKQDPALLQAVSALQANGTLVFTKALSTDDILDGTNGVVLKGPDGAGRGNTIGVTLDQLFDQVKTHSPSQLIITSGGVGTSEQLKHYVELGAFGVGIGTMFAVSAESKISTETKLKLVNSGAADVRRIENGKTNFISQNAIVFSNTAVDNDNNTRGLMAGIKNPTVGHVFIGKGIEHATEILTCEEIVTQLVKDL